MAGALAVASGRDARGVAVVMAAVLTGQLSIGWLNDYVDAPRDAVARRTDKPIIKGTVSRRTVGWAAAAAGALCVPLSFLSGPAAGLTHVIAVLVAWSYNLRLKATEFSVVPYAVSFGLLPAFVVQGLPGAPRPAVWVVVAAGLLGSAAHFANVLPDLDDDRATGVRGLPHRLGRTASIVTAAALVAAATVVLTIAPPGPPDAFGWAALGGSAAVLAAGGVLARRPGSRAAFRAIIVVAVLDVALLVAAGNQIR